MAYLRVSINAFCIVLLSLLVHRGVRLFLNYREARKIGLPIIIIPTNWQDPIWLPIEKKLSWIRNLPFGLGAWYKYSGAFTIVTPNQNEIVLSSPANVHEVMGKYKKWPRPKHIYNVFETFGPNVDSVNGEEWQRHRKVINQAFVEGNMEAVWNGAIKQADQWLTKLSGNRNLEELALNCDTVSANVLMYAAFNQDRDFDTSFKEVQPGHKNPFGETMLYMVRNVVLAWAFGRAELPRWLEPKFLTTMRQAKQELLVYFKETLEEREGILTKALLEANDDDKVNGRNYLEQEEIFGNLFVMNLAGFDTTSYAMQFSIASLAIHPEIQEWARQDVTTYKDTFERAVRLRAVMYETLRLYGAASTLLRQSSETQIMSINGYDRVIPPTTYVTANLSAPNNDPKVWGPDVLEWKPQRWVVLIDGVEMLRKEEIYTWSVGPRICPGKKFSQVEFTAVIGKLLEQFRLEGSPELNEILSDFDINITPKMNTSKGGKVTFIRR